MQTQKASLLWAAGISNGSRHCVTVFHSTTELFIEHAQASPLNPTHENPRASNSAWLTGQPTGLRVSIKETAQELFKWLWALPFLPHCDGLKWQLPSLAQPLSWELIPSTKHIYYITCYSSELLHIQGYFLWYKISSLAVNRFFALLSLLGMLWLFNSSDSFGFSTVWVCEIKQIYRECMPPSLWIFHTLSSRTIQTFKMSWIISQLLYK